jgi:mono/diheme cytochrome c family protein
MNCGKSQIMKSIIFLLTALPLASLATLPAADPSGVAFFEQKVRPVLVEHCYSCHSAEAKKLKGNLYLDSKAGWEKGGDSGEPVIVPGKPEASLLIRTVQHLEADMEMPPKKPKLPDAVIADLVTWVKMGAPDPRDHVKIEAKRGDKSWWSLQPNKVASALAESSNLELKLKPLSIDGFITAKLAEKKLTLNPAADPRALIRRMSYDVTGLPPKVEEVETFAKAHQANPRQAVESLVDRLLASPCYGERWGRHWLDVIRFGESNGFERNFVIDDLWPFRDYIIKSINDDKPFNQFITEHLAGDVIGKDNPQVEVGSAFLVAGPYDDVGNQDITAQKNIRAATLDDMITATSGAFLGLTINCARCHNHKFDPIPTEDYYRLRAAFEGVTHGRRAIATKEQREAFVAATKPLAAEFKKLEAERASLDQAIEARAKAAFAKSKYTRPKIDQNGTDESFAVAEAKHLKFVILGLTGDHQPAAKGKRSGGGKLTEFQVWSAEDPNRNFALASHGTKAEGAKSATAEDFPEAYGPQYCIDGMLGEAWFIGEPAVLTLTFAKQEKINRISFINARGDRSIDEGKVRGATPCEYEIQVSSDGKTWRTVASDEGREPWTPAHGIARSRHDVITKDEQAKLALLDNQIAAVQAKLKAVPELPQMWVGTHKQSKEPTFVHKGGDPMKPADAVLPASLSVLDQVTKPYALKPDADEGERRLALAKWITSNDNPLTPRVLANRVWQWHFGTGIVDTPSDFGFLGSKPTHPELLDYLASRLVANGWKLKPLHREILLSQTYLQSAAHRENAAKEDKDARLLWRFPPRRLSAEELRDTMLTVGGKLQLEPMGGPGFRLYRYLANNVSTYVPLDTHGPESYRRAVYHQNARASVVDVLNDFDLPDIAFAAPKRANTTTPLQALTLLNHSFTLDMAKALASRLQTGDAVTQAYRITFQREPTAKEHAAATQLIVTHGAGAFCRALLNANELLYLE